MGKDAAERIRVQPRKGNGINVDLVADLDTKVLTSVLFVMAAAGYSSGDHSGHAEETRAWLRRSSETSMVDSLQGCDSRNGSRPACRPHSSSGRGHSGSCVGWGTGFETRA